jgi:hypothetical protein
VLSASNINSTNPLDQKIDHPINDSKEDEKEDLTDMFKQFKEQLNIIDNIESSPKAKNLDKVVLLD